MDIEYYCDQARHLVCLPYSIENLHRMAADLGLSNHWFHVDHYDIPQGRLAEIMSKCTVVSSKQIVIICRRHGA